MTTDDACPRSFLLIVTQTEPKLYEYLRRSLAPSYPSAHVMLDRRGAERRESTASIALDRRRAAERRARPGIEDQLRARGWAVVHRRERA